MSLPPLLNRLYGDYHRTEYLSSDPLEFVHRYRDPFDQEAVALLAALLAYGNVKQIKKSVEDALYRMKTVSQSPADFVRSLRRPSQKSRLALDGFVHRFNVGADLFLLFRLLEGSWSLHGSLGAHFVSRLAPEAPDFSAALDALVTEWRGRARELGGAPESFHYLLTAPADGSCCKRWCMFLRWMGRRDPKSCYLDPGLWTERGALAHTFPRGRFLRSEQLVIPLDTHTGRISQYLALTARKSLNWKAALEVTEALRACDAADPVKYDFALARLGILDLCQRAYRPEICSRCQLVQGCQFARAGQRRLDRRAAAAAVVATGAVAGTPAAARTAASRGART